MRRHDLSLLLLVAVVLFGVSVLAGAHAPPIETVKNGDRAAVESLNRAASRVDEPDAGRLVTPEQVI